MKTLVFGSRGLVGSAIVRAVCRRSDLFVSPTSIRWDDPNSSEADLRSVMNDFRQFVDDDEWSIYWAAGKGHLGSTSTSLEVEEHLFAMMLQNISYLKFTSGLVVLMSSAGALWSMPTQRKISESSPVTGFSPYAQLKLRQEDALVRFSRENNMRGLSARLSSVYGVNQDLHKPQGLISRLCISSITRRPTEIFVPLETSRNYVFSDDAARMIMNTTQQLMRISQSQGASSVRLFCSKQEHSIASICESIEKVTGRRLLLNCQISGDATRYPLHIRLQSQFQESMLQFEDTTLAAGITKVFHDILDGFQSGRFAEMK